MRIDYSTDEINEELLKEIVKALRNVKWGSVEIFIQDSKVIQITERNIKKMVTFPANEIARKGGK